MRRIVVWFFAVFVFIPSAPVHAADISSLDSHVRKTDRDIRSAIQQGMSGSPLFRWLMARLDQSDVIVYVQWSRELPSTVNGHLKFIGSSAGSRYVVINLAWNRLGPRVLATLGHELQHALEVAEHPEIVDQASMRQAYGRFGEASRDGTTISYDTPAAIEAGERVWSEVMHGIPVY